MHPHREGNWMQGIFAWCFFTLAWVMTCRSVTTAEILLSSMRWIDDCICIDVAKEKSDQVGERQFPRHIYANPINPRICPILALAVYIFCIYIGNLADTNQPLFPGDCQEDRFSKVLRSVHWKISLNTCSICWVGMQQILELTALEKVLLHMFYLMLEGQM